MTRALSVVALTALLSMAVGSSAAQAQGASTNLGSVTLGRKVMADGKPLTAGTYQVRLTNDMPTPAVGQSPDAERYVEFLRAGKVMGRELATVVTNADIKSVAKTTPPKAGTSKVELLKGEQYLRVWINRGGSNYIINLPAGA